MTGSKLKTLLEGFYKIEAVGKLKNGNYVYRLHIKKKSGFYKASGYWKLLSARNGYHTFQQVKEVDIVG